MKKLIALFPVLLFSLVLMAQPPKVAADKGTVFGEYLTEEGAVTADVLAENLDVTGQSKEVTITGKVIEVCKAEGCWVRVQTRTGSIMVKMKDHAFLVPVALEGKTIATAGVATYKVTSVEQLRHFAEDAGKSKKEIALITTPKKEIVFQATGIKVL